MILQHTELESRINAGDIIVSAGARLAPNSIDICLSRHAWILDGWHNICGEILPVYSLCYLANKTAHFQAGRLYIVATEQICGSRPGSGLVPAMYGRSSAARSGIQVHAAGLGEEGFLNRWAMEIVATSQHGAFWRFEEPICQIAFSEARGSGAYNGQYKQPEHTETADEILAAWSPLALLPSSVRNLSVHTAQVANHATFVGAW